MGTGRSRSIIIFCPDVRTRDITLTTANSIRDLRWTKWASGVSLHGSNPEPLMSANGMVRPCSCPPPVTNLARGSKDKGARHVPEPQQRNRRDRHRYRQKLIPCRRVG